ncbi:MAG: aminodeoxychorismate/anthranilate synthase component II [Bacteroidales bacterium]|nr:aminodeoxychorismate/anthranilate synthase component II [Bacteroidales bacterium]
MKIMVLDNYDSFTYNLVHILKELSGQPVDVFRNDDISVAEAAGYDKIIISPGPGIPDEAGITKKLISHYGPSKSILGVCLGCQAIAEVFGGSLTNLDRVYHGVKTEIIITDTKDKLFSDVPSTFEAGRYHSWVVNDRDLPSVLRITARDSEGMVMALSHVEYDVKGVQFHPESVMTEYGKQILSNWLAL